MSISSKEFVDEAEELLSEASLLLLDIQDADSSDPDPEALNGVFRAMHTIKGMAGLYGHQSITDVSHALENILDNIRLGKTTMGDQAVAFFLKHIDTLRTFLNCIREETPIDEKLAAACVTEIDEFMSSDSGDAESDPLAAIDGYESIFSVMTEYEEHRLKSNLKAGKGVYKMDVVYSLEDFDLRLKELTTLIKEFAELISTMPISDGIPMGSIGFSMIIGTGKSTSEVIDRTECAVEVISPLAIKKTPAAPVQKVMEESELTLKTTSTTVRVDIEKLDRLLNSVGELNLVKNNTRKLWAEMSEAFGRSHLVIDLYKLVQNMERKLHELQADVLEIRMVPFGQIFRRLAQVVRRYKKSAGKEIELLMFGDDTEIDKFLAEEVVDPLMHMVRNSIDHGIESPEERRKAGKPPVGSIHLKASQKGNSVVVEIIDDGRGLDVEMIREKAIERGMISATEQLEDSKVLDLMFVAGFSTKESVSETSGRGVGLDVVKAKMASMGGFVETSSRLGEGTTFTLTFPITLTIVKSLMVRVGREIFAMPLSSMKETMDVFRDDIQHLNGGDVCSLRGELLPVVGLDQMLQIEGDGHKNIYAIIIGHGDKKVGLLVDELLKQQEIVIKPLSDYFDGINAFAGAAEIASNEVVMVLDAEALLVEAFEKRDTAHAS